VIFLDTNVIAESMRRTPEPRVIDWLIVHDAEVAVSTVVMAEIVFGIEKIRLEERSSALWAQLLARRERFEDRIFAFDEEAALVFGRIQGRASRQGHLLAPLDAMIAAIALRHEAALATRNVRDFDVPDLRVIDPWSA